MKKFFFLLILASAALQTQAQNWIPDSVVLGPGYTNRGFYSLENGNVGSVPFNTRDWMIDVSAVYSATIRINGGFFAECYKYTAGDTADWATLDTTGLKAGNGWVRARDDRQSLSPSAFEYGEIGHPNYGWGDYNQITHVVTGNSLFVYKTVGNGTPNSAQWKKIWIKELSASPREFIIWAADLDGGNQQTITISKEGVTNKSFIYYSFATNEVYNDEPAANSFDLIFTKFEDEYSFMGGTSIQAVTGVENNNGVLVARVQGIPANDAVYTDYTLETDIYGIGHDWKTLNMQTFQFVLADSLSYFVQDVPGNIWQIRFTGFLGTSTGKYRFEKRKVAFASVEESVTLGAWNVFPNPTSDYAQVVFSAKTASPVRIALIDLSGKVRVTENITSQVGINQHTLSLQGKNLAPGVYVLQIHAGETVKSTKLVVR